MPQNQNFGQAPDYGQVLNAWHAPEYIKQEKSLTWIITSLVIGLALITASVLMRNYLMIIVVILFGVVIYILHKKEPLMLDIAITERGVKIGEKFYRYKELEEFWIIYDPPVKTLNLKTKQSFFAEISLQLADRNPTEIREILLDYLDENEDKDEENTTDRLTRIMKI